MIPIWQGERAYIAELGGCAAALHGWKTLLAHELLRKRGGMGIKHRAGWAGPDINILDLKIGVEP